jgi:methyl-accepting chemotaxis protein
MTTSIQEVAQSARQAAQVVRQASTTAEVGGAAMDRTVATITNLRDTVANTALKVKQLGQSSQQISKAIALINQIALQTDLLAINAEIEAARSGVPMMDCIAPKRVQDKTSMTKCQGEAI